jgi:hypothetical protein
MASLKYSANSSLQTVTLGSNYTAASGTMTLTAGHGARLPATGDYWIAYNNGAGTIRIFKVTARSTDTLTVVADATEGSGDGNISSGETLRWALTVSALTQLRADIVAQGALVLLRSLTASASASLDFATRTDGSALIQTDFDIYQIEMIEVLPATDGTSLNMRVSTDGGSSYISTSNVYSWGSYTLTGSSAGAQGNVTNATFIGISPNMDSATGSYALSGSVKLYNPLGTTNYKSIVGQVTAVTSAGVGLGNIYTLQLFGSYKSTTAVDAIQFLAGSGNIASGTIRVYGLAKS